MLFDDDLLTNMAGDESPLLPTPQVCPENVPVRNKFSKSCTPERQHCHFAVDEDEDEADEEFLVGNSRPSDEGVLLPTPTIDWRQLARENGRRG